MDCFLISCILKTFTFPRLTMDRIRMNSFSRPLFVCLFYFYPRYPVRAWSRRLFFNVGGNIWQQSCVKFNLEKIKTHTVPYLEEKNACAPKANVSVENVHLAHFGQCFFPHWVNLSVKIMRCLFWRWGITGFSLLPAGIWSMTWDHFPLFLDRGRIWSPLLLFFFVVLHASCKDEISSGNEHQNAAWDGRKTCERLNEDRRMTSASIFEKTS